MLKNLPEKIFLKLKIHHFEKKGYHRYYATFWRKEMLQSYKSSNLPKKQIRWAKKHGFMPFHLEQYGYVEGKGMPCNVISDDDYYWLYPLNRPEALNLIDDKLTMKYALAPFDDCLPKYYYHILKDGTIFRLMDCPKELGATANGIADLLMEKGVLAAKLIHGTYGVGFYKFEYKDGSFYANGTQMDRNEFLKFISTLKNYIVTEFVEMHPQLKKLYPNSANTLRIMVINEHGDDPMIPFAFMRIGTKASGIVDNTARGGMFCKVDVDTGRYYDGELCRNHVITPVKEHPDSHEPIEGILPNWDFVKDTLIKISLNIPGLRNAGYDVAITENGFNIIEINSHQGLHKAHLLPDSVKDFFNRELETKRKRFKIER